MIAFCGHRGSGKDTCADYLVEHYQYKKATFAQPLKEVLKILFQFNNHQLYGNEKEIVDDRWGLSPRHAMQLVGTEMIRFHLPDYFVKFMELNLTKKMVISDLRFLNEAEMLTKHGAIIILVEKDHLDDPHLSEQEYKLINYHYVIHNKGSKEDLFKELETLLDLIE